MTGYPSASTRMLEDGASKGLQVTTEEVEAAKDVYYTLAGWDVATGVPQAATLERLGLGWTRN